MKPIPLVLVCVATLMATSCANYRPIVDPQTIADPARYEADLADCQRLAGEIDPAARGAVGAVLGGLFGAAIESK